MRLEPETEFASEEKRARDWNSVFDKLLGDAVPARSGAPSGLSRCASQAKPPAAIAKGEEL